MKTVRCHTIAILALSLVACTAVDPALQTRAGRLIAEIDPVPFRIAVARPVMDVEPRAGSVASGLRFAFTPAQLQDRLVSGLRTVRAATEVSAVGEGDVAAARARHFDLLLRPRVTALRIAYDGGSSNSILSSFLWITTWIGGFFVGDSTYDARLEIAWDIVNPHDNLTIDHTVCSSEKVDLTWWDRNTVFSLPLLQTLVLPPVWTSDNDEVTSRSLSDLACARVAARLASYLKTEFVRGARTTLGEFRTEQPRNGDSAGSSVRFRGRIVATNPITSVEVFVNDRQVLTEKGEELPSAVSQRIGNTFQLPLDLRLDLAAGRNSVAVEFSVGGVVTSRTISVYGVPESAPSIVGAMQ